MLELNLHDSHEAVQVLEEALAASKRAQTYTRRDFIYAFLALAYAKTGQHDKATLALQTALQLVERLGYMEGRALCTEMQGRISVIRGEPGSARHHFNHALVQFEALGNVAGTQRCHEHLNCLGRPNAPGASETTF